MRVTRSLLTQKLRDWRHVYTTMILGVLALVFLFLFDYPLNYAVGLPLIAAQVGTLLMQLRAVRSGKPPYDRKDVNT